MYFIEFIVNKFLKKKKQEHTFNPLDEKSSEEEDYDNCEHIFMPIDSSGEILSCSKCGFVVNRKDLKKQNIFKNKVIK